LCKVFPKNIGGINFFSKILKELFDNLDKYGNNIKIYLKNCICVCKCKVLEQPYL
jgi:hypothetical protein